MSAETVSLKLGAVVAGVLAAAACVLGIVFGRAQERHIVADHWWAYCVELWDGQIRSPKKWCTEHFQEVIGFEDPNKERR
jgi:hypothetical protein